MTRAGAAILTLSHCRLLDAWEGWICVPRLAAHTLHVFIHRAGWEAAGDGIREGIPLGRCVLALARALLVTTEAVLR